MNKISYEEFKKLSEEEKCEKYKDLDEHDKFLARLSQPISPVSVGNKRKLTKQEKKEADEFEKAIKEGKLDEWFNSNKPNKEKI